MKNILLLLGMFVLMVVLISITPISSGEDDHGGPTNVSRFLFYIVTILLAAKIGGELFETWNQPAVLGELVFGILLGNLHLAGLTGLEILRGDASLALFAEIGVILLLFEVGLESDLGKILEVGTSALLVAILGITAPMLLGYFVSVYFRPEATFYAHLFVGATLAATSVGITARVLKDLRKMDSKESRIILGAAVVDDVLGLIILAVITGLISSATAVTAGTVSLLPILIVISKSIIFLVLAVFPGRFIIAKILEMNASAKVGGMPIVLSICHCFALAGLAQLFGLAPIIGAFVAGLVLDEKHYRQYTTMGPGRFRSIVAPISSMLVPIFFVLMGLQVDFASLLNWHVLQFAVALSLVALISKQVCSIGVIEKDLNRLAVGAGMIPRGEVGLIFAGMGAALTVSGKPIFPPDMFSVMVMTVMVTTLVTPPLLKAMFARGQRVR